MATDYHKIKYINQDVQDSVTGFIRECRDELPEENQYYDIPSLIIYTCILYYHIAEFFSKDHGPNMILSDNDSIVAIKKGENVKHQIDYDIVFGNVKIEFGQKYIYQWTFKILNLIDEQLGDEIVIGIGYKKAKLGGYNTFNYAYHLPELFDHLVSYRNDGYIDRSDAKRTAFDKDDIVKMEFNTSNMEIQFYINNEPQPVYNREQFDIKYITDELKTNVYMAVSMDSDNPNTVKLLNFRIISKLI